MLENMRSIDTLKRDYLEPNRKEYNPEGDFETDYLECNSNSNVNLSNVVMYHPLMYVYMKSKTLELIRDKKMVYRPWANSDELFESPEKAIQFLNGSSLPYYEKKTCSRIFEQHRPPIHNSDDIPVIAAEYEQKLGELCKKTHDKSVKVQLFFPNGKMEQLFLKASSITNQEEPMIVNSPVKGDGIRRDFFYQSSIHDLLWWDYGCSYQNSGCTYPSQGDKHFELSSKKISDEMMFGGHAIPFPEYFLPNKGDKLVVYWNFKGTTAPENVWACGLFLSVGLDITSDTSSPFPYPRGPVILAYYSGKDRGIISLDQEMLADILEKLEFFRQSGIRQIIKQPSATNKIPSSVYCRLPKILYARYYVTNFDFKTCGTYSELLDLLYRELENVQAVPEFCKAFLLQAGFGSNEDDTNHGPLKRKQQAVALLLNIRVLFSLSDLCSFQGLDINSLPLELREMVRAIRLNRDANDGDASPQEDVIQNSTSEMSVRVNVDDKVTKDSEFDGDSTNVVEIVSESPSCSDASSTLLITPEIHKVSLKDSQHVKVFSDDVVQTSERVITDSPTGELSSHTISATILGKRALSHDTAETINHRVQHETADVSETVTLESVILESPPPPKKQKSSETQPEETKTTSIPQPKPPPKTARHKSTGTSSKISTNATAKNAKPAMIQSEEQAPSAKDIMPSTPKRAATRKATSKTKTTQKTEGTD